jgi:hypothetical protein
VSGGGAPTRRANRLGFDSTAAFGLMLDSAPMRVRGRTGRSGLVEGVNRIIAALDVVQVERIAKSGKRDQAAETGDQFCVIGEAPKAAPKISADRY